MTAVFENNYIDIVCIIQQLIIFPAVLFIECQDIAVKGNLQGVKMFHAIASPVRSYLTKIGQYQFSNTGQAGDGEKVKIENRVAVLKPMRKGTIEVAVDNPLLLFQFAL